MTDFALFNTVINADLFFDLLNWQSDNILSSHREKEQH